MNDSIYNLVINSFNRSTTINFGN
ncbi:hypothetical protein DFA_06984 [Cavenderia fasciculata]|uniref:Uncharacterized protein n=1 Tax=Cavenderia fasciculata TaxID=261658 RepID=F4PX78_CACFS|nr:hypothetical protein DFA_06984 [Cavenderia fasciculata]EGG19881.1 hypothetical protein DFA_06984 [Cavenderia fasciculata]|eukprot:XP_004366864.1 hypothetical protein DFA_06984 [Cavenderia fasciculata]